VEYLAFLHSNNYSADYSPIAFVWFVGTCKSNENAPKFPSSILFVPGLIDKVGLKDSWFGPITSQRCVDVDTVMAKRNLRPKEFTERTA